MSGPAEGRPASSGTATTGIGSVDRVGSLVVPCHGTVPSARSTSASMEEYTSLLICCTPGKASSARSLPASENPRSGATAAGANSSPNRRFSAPPQ